MSRCSLMYGLARKGDKPLRIVITTWYTDVNVRRKASMMKSSNENIFRVTGHLCGEFTGHWWIPRTIASDVELCCFLRSAPE